MSVAPRTRRRERECHENVTILGRQLSEIAARIRSSWDFREKIRRIVIADGYAMPKQPVVDDDLLKHTRQKVHQNEDGIQTQEGLSEIGDRLGNRRLRFVR